MGMLREYVRVQSMLRKGKGWRTGGAGGSTLWSKQKRVNQTSTPVSRYSGKKVGPTADKSSDEGCCFIVPHDGIPRFEK